VPAWIEVDEARTRQVLLNLLEHALQRTVTGQIQLRIKQAGPQLIFEVQDTGPTLSDDVAKHLIEGGSLNQHENLSTLGRTNLILFMANSLTQLMGGRLEIKQTEHFGD
jgi:signal transduction histidine kinase